MLQNDAEIARDRAKEDLVNLEKALYADRRARDVELQCVRRQADEKRQQQELFQRRIVRLSFNDHHILCNELDLVISLILHTPL